MAQPLSAQNVADVKKILDAAHAAGVTVDVSLWSFDMLKSGPIANNMALLTQDANRQAYIDHVLTPLVTALKGYPGLHSWETFNEPEGMTTGASAAKTCSVWRATRREASKSPALQAGCPQHV